MTTIFLMPCKPYVKHLQIYNILRAGNFTEEKSSEVEIWFPLCIESTESIFILLTSSIALHIMATGVLLAEMCIHIFLMTQHA
jgi:hypothetical protein